MFTDDWTPEQIIQALQEKQTTLNELMLNNHITALTIRRLDQVISQTLDVSLEELWPSRYKEEDEWNF